MLLSTVHMAISTSAAAAALSKISEVQNERKTELNKYCKNGELCKSDEKKDSAYPIFGVFLESGGPSDILKMTDFSLEEFSNLFQECSKNTKNGWFLGREKPDSVHNV